MTRTTGILLLTLLSALCNGCATPRPFRAWRPPSDLPKTALLLDVTFETADELTAEADCRLVLRSLSGGGRAEISLPATLAQKSSGTRNGPVHRLVMAEPGTYAIDELHCYGNRSWKMPETGPDDPTWTVPEGKIAYGGYFRLRSGSTAQPISFEWRARPDADSLAGYLSNLPAGDRARVVSGFSGKPILATAVTLTPSLSVSFRVRAANVDMSQEKAPVVAPCLEQEARRNPTVVGRLIQRVTYKGAELEAARTIKPESTHSDAFLGCVDAAYKDFKPARAGKTEFEITY